MIDYKSLSESDNTALEEIGAFHTFTEIRQQPDAWAATAGIVLEQQEQLRSFFDRAGILDAADAGILLMGAGTSEFVGLAAQQLLQRELGTSAFTTGTTEITTHSQAIVPPHRHLLVVSFARSGNSPESLAAYRELKRIRPDAAHLIVTCNSEGELARKAAEDANTTALVLPEETNDRSLAMTSAFSSMVVAAIGCAFIRTPERYRQLVDDSASAVREFLNSVNAELSEAAATDFSRACFLGSGGLRGIATESALKMLEMSGGRVATVFNSYLGLRHGPQSFVNDHCLVVGNVETDEHTQQYERDLINELARKRQSCGIVLVGASAKFLESVKDARPTSVAAGFAKLPAEARVITDIVPNQLLATLTSIKLGHEPDSPSPEGTITRVVSGVTIYPRGES